MLISCNTKPTGNYTQLNQTSDLSMFYDYLSLELIKISSNKEKIINLSNLSTCVQMKIAVDVVQV